jgi:hypothetical protein
MVEVGSALDARKVSGDSADKSTEQREDMIERVLWKVTAFSSTL